MSSFMSIRVRVSGLVVKSLPIYKVVEDEAPLKHYHIRTSDIILAVGYEPHYVLRKKNTLRT